MNADCHREINGNQDKEVIERIVENARGHYVNKVNQAVRSALNDIQLQYNNFRTDRLFDVNDLEHRSYTVSSSSNGAGGVGAVGGAAIGSLFGPPGIPIGGILGWLVGSDSGGSETRYTIDASKAINSVCAKLDTAARYFLEDLQTKLDNYARAHQPRHHPSTRISSLQKELRQCQQLISWCSNFQNEITRLLVKVI